MKVNNFAEPRGINFKMKVEVPITECLTARLILCANQKYQTIRNKMNRHFSRVAI